MTPLVPPEPPDITPAAAEYHCGTPYENRAAANAAIRRIKRNTGLYAKHCDGCGDWHVRKQDNLRRPRHRGRM